MMMDPVVMQGFAEGGTNLLGDLIKQRRMEAMQREKDRREGLKTAADFQMKGLDTANQAVSSGYTNLQRVLSGLMG